jgi:hypothetical protein
MRKVRLHVSRSAVSVEDPDGWREPTRALVALGIEAGRIGIIGVGEEEAELVERLARTPPKNPYRGMRAKIIAASASRLPPGAKPRVVRPGEDPYWDRTWQDSYALRSADPARSGEVLLIAPLDERSWSPHLVHGLLMYVLWTSPCTRDRIWPEFRRPQIELRPADDLGGLHYQELVDQLRALWGERRVILPEGRPVAPPPPTPTLRAARIAHAVFWVALLGSFLLSRGGKPSVAALIAAGVALVAFLARRVAKARARAELPRRQRNAD